MGKPNQLDGRMNVLIGTGFHCTEETRAWKMELLRLWFWNTRKVFPTEKIVIVASAPLALSPHDLAIYNGTPDKSIPMPVVIEHEDYIKTPTAYQKDGKYNPDVGHPYICGWSVSWIIPSLVAYAEGKHFVYKEQDCFAFGNWAEELHIMKGDIVAGKSNCMCCEQSLFRIRHSSIPTAVKEYLCHDYSDCEVTTEEKFKLLEAWGTNTFEWMLMGVGRDRPLTPDAPMWYMQKVKEDKDFIAEVLELKKLGLLGYPQPT